MPTGLRCVSAVIFAIAACAAPAPRPEPASVPAATRKAAASPVLPAAPASASSSAQVALPPAVPEYQRPLPDDMRARWRSIAADPAPRSLAGDRHWLVSDERKPWLFHAQVSGKGGMLLGVGADQIWLFAGWARPEIAVCLDFDRWVVDLHDIMVMMLSRSSDAAELASWWTTARAREVQDWIAQSSENAEVQSSRRHAFREAREKIRVRLRHFATSSEFAASGTFMTDPSQFEHLASLARAGRLLALRADMGAGTAMQSVGDLARIARIPVRVLYLSNVEYYVPYGAGSFRKNLLAMPFDEQSTVLHTVPHHGTMAGTQYYYVVEGGPSFRRWLESGKVASFKEHFKQAVRMSGQSSAEAFAMPDEKP
jgi:hypothetical protein